MTTYFPTTGHMEACRYRCSNVAVTSVHDAAATLLQLRVQANAPAASYWLRHVLDDGSDLRSPLCKGAGNGASNAGFVDTVRIVCEASGVYETVGCPSVCPSGPSFGLRTPPRRVCCCGPGGQEISIDYCTACARQQMRAVSRCQLT